MPRMRKSLRAAMPILLGVSVGALLLTAVLTALLGVLPLPSWGKDVPIPPPPTRRVTDEPGFLSTQAREALDARLEAYERQTGHQVLVWVGSTTGQVPLEDWTVRAFERWRVGRQGLDDGLVLFVFPQDRRLRIEVGYGLESVVTDAQASRIIRDTAVPELRAGHADAAVTRTVDALLTTLGGEKRSPSAAPEPSKALGGVLFILGYLGLFLILAQWRRLARLLGFNVPSGRRSSGGGDVEGGGFGGRESGDFSGGGGRSGGGGASGSW